MKKLTVAEHFKSLSMAEWGMAEAIEADLEKSLTMGLTEDEMVKFVQTVMAIRKVMPEANVGGVFDAALMAGLSYIGDKRTIARIRSGKFAYEANGIKPKKRNSNKGGSTLK